MSRREAFDHGLAPVFLAPNQPAEQAPPPPTPGSMPRKGLGYATRTHTTSGRPRGFGTVARQNMGDDIKPVLRERGINWTRFSTHLYANHSGNRTQAVTWAHGLLKTNPEAFHAFLDQIQPRNAS